MDYVFRMSDTEGDKDRHHFLAVPIPRVNFNLSRVVLVRQTNPEV